jgi:hypothetical protein
MKGRIDDAWTLYLGRAPSDAAAAEPREIGSRRWLPRACQPAPCLAGREVAQPEVPGRVDRRASAYGRHDGIEPTVACKDGARRLAPLLGAAARSGLRLSKPARRSSS